MKSNESMIYFIIFKFLINRLKCQVFMHVSSLYLDKYLMTRLFENIERTFTLQLRCDERFTHAFTACNCVFKVITMVGSNQGNYFENATACSKRTLKTTVATHLKRRDQTKYKAIQYVNLLNKIRLLASLLFQFIV